MLDEEEAEILETVMVLVRLAQGDHDEGGPTHQRARECKLNVVMCGRDMASDKQNDRRDERGLAQRVTTKTLE